MLTKDPRCNLGYTVWRGFALQFSISWDKSLTALNLLASAVTLFFLSACALVGDLDCFWSY